MNRVLPQAVIYFAAVVDGPVGPRGAGRAGRGRAARLRAAGAAQGGYGDEISIDPINLQPGDDTVIVRRLREELGRR